MDSKISDIRIIELYFERSEAAISATEEKYGKYCRTVAYNVLFSHEDAEECVNDAYLRVWNSVPPERPVNFKAFLAKIVRNLSLDRYFKNKAKKRSQYAESAFDELSECLPDTRVSSVSDDIALKDSINSFLASLPAETRMIFMQRYWYFLSVSEIAKKRGVSENKVKVTLSRTRKKFREHLLNEGIEI